MFTSIVGITTETSLQLNLIRGANHILLYEPLRTTSSLQSNMNMVFRVEKRNKHARVLAARQSPKFENNGGNFVDLVNKNSYKLSLLLQFSR